mgnify:FL=1
MRQHNNNNRTLQSMPRRRRGLNHNSLQGKLDLSARQVGGPKDPPSVTTSIITTVRVALPVGSETSGSITPSKLIAAIPGATGYWKNVRLIRASIWGTNGLSVDLIATESNRRFADTGVPGARSSVVHMSLPLMTRANWYSSTASTVLAQWGTTADNRAVVHATIEVTS